MSGGNPQMRTSPLLDLSVQQSRELLNRPEAQAILQGRPCLFFLSTLMCILK